MRLVLDTKVRRFVSLALLLFFAIPVGLSVAGCSKSAPPVYCNGLSSGPVVGQAVAVTLSPSLATTGESLSFGQIGQSLSASAADCHGNAVTESKYTYAIDNMAVADINPSTGAVCAGTWNRNQGGGIPDFTTCTPYATTPPKYYALVTATATDGVVSNPIPVYVHPVVTSIVLGSPSSCAVDGSGNIIDPATNCTCPTYAPNTEVATPYSQNACVSQGTTAQLIARVYANGSTSSANNITCQVGHLTFSAQSAASVANIDENGVATANQPGSTIITASVANSSSASSAGFFSTCPPARIVLAAPGQTSNPVNVSLNNLQPLTATVFDQNNVQLTGLQLEYVSTTPATIPASSGSVTPIYPGSAAITAVCQPNTCNPAPFSQIGYLGNGTPLTSNPITVNTIGTSTTVLYAASTQSQYIEPYDFTTNAASPLIKLQFVPNSMAITENGQSIFLGSSQGMMVVTTASNSQSAVYTAVQGLVLTVSPDGSTVVVTDPVRQTVSLVSGSNGSVETTYGGVGTSASWTPDSQTVYISTTGNVLLTHSNFTNWQSTTTDEPYTTGAVTVPSVGAYFSGSATSGDTKIEGVSYCPSTVSTVPGTPPGITNNFAPLADTKPGSADVLAATNSGNHILGATAKAPATLTDLIVTLPTPPPNPPANSSYACPATVNPGYFVSTITTQLLSGVVPATITGVIPASNSALAFVTYTGTSGKLPVYVPAASGAGALSYITLGNGATAASAPVSGVFSTDNLTFYAGTSGDNQVHLFSISGTTATETKALAPLLPCSTGGTAVPTPACTSGTIVAPNLLAQQPKKVTN